MSTYPFPPLTPQDVQQIAQALSAALGQAWERLEAEYQQVLNTVDLGRNEIVLAQLREFQQAIENFQASTLGHATTFVTQSLPVLYASGAIAANPTVPFSWTQSNIDALTSLASDSYADFLRRSEEAGRTAGAFARAVREAARNELPQIAAGHTTSKQVAQALRDRLEREHGITAATYADGSIHSMRDYTEMAALTKGAVAYNFGAFTTLSNADVSYVEVFDGPECGWTEHDDPDLANGSIRSLDDAQNYPISHPRCVRSFGGRPDITSDDEAAAADTSMSTDTQADQLDQVAQATGDLAVPRTAQGQRDRVFEQRSARTAGPSQSVADVLAGAFQTIPEE